MLSIEIGLRRLKEVSEIKNIIHSYFHNHFAVDGGNRLISAHVQFNVLNELVSEDMVREFSENEVHRAVWECEGSKSSKLDGVKFDFVKEFWSDINGDFQRVISDFHAHDKFVKGANCSFLALIPKKTSPERSQIFVQYRL